MGVLQSKERILSAHLVGPLPPPDLTSSPSSTSSLSSDSFLVSICFASHSSLSVVYLKVSLQNSPSPSIPTDFSYALTSPRPNFPSNFFLSLSNFLAGSSITFVCHAPDDMWSILCGTSSGRILLFDLKHGGSEGKFTFSDPVLSAANMNSSRGAMFAYATTSNSNGSKLLFVSFSFFFFSFFFIISES